MNVGQENRGRILRNDELHLQRILDRQSWRSRILLCSSHRPREGLHGWSFRRSTSYACSHPIQEPHPADDLNGADVARKLAILARSIPSLQSALPEGYLSVSTRSLVPEALASVASGSDFVDRLPEFDAEFEKLRDDARAEGSVLRFVGVIDVEKGLVKADLEKYVLNAFWAIARNQSFALTGTPRPIHLPLPSVALTTS